MTAVTDMQGVQIGRLVVIDRAPHEPNQSGAHWNVRCECGTEFVALGASLRKQHVRSCGCRRRFAGGNRTTHGARYTPEYRAWTNMIGRCCQPKNKDYGYYGGRGITVCDEWRHDFAAFLAHIGPRPAGRMSLDRIDNDGNYEPGNVRWATWSEQQKNRRRPHPAARWPENDNGTATRLESAAVPSTNGG